METSLRFTFMSTGLRSWLVTACREAREKAGANRTQVASLINAGEGVVVRWELMRGGWNPETDRLVDAYAEIAGVDPLEIWGDAVSRWRAAEGQPSANETRPSRLKVPPTPGQTSRAKASRPATKRRDTA